MDAGGKRNSIIAALIAASKRAVALRYWRIQRPKGSQRRIAEALSSGLGQTSEDFDGRRDEWIESDPVLQ